MCGVGVRLPHTGRAWSDDNACAAGASDQYPATAQTGDEPAYQAYPPVSVRRWPAGCDTDSGRAAGGNAPEAVAKLKETAERFKAYTGEIHPSPLFGAILAVLFVTVALWDTHRLAALGVSALLFIGLGVVGALRVQRLRFDSIADARSAYFARLDELATKGYLDATQE